MIVLEKQLRNAGTQTELTIFAKQFRRPFKVAVHEVADDGFGTISVEEGSVAVRSPCLEFAHESNGCTTRTRSMVISACASKLTLNVYKMCHQWTHEVVSCLQTRTRSTDENCSFRLRIETMPLCMHDYTHRKDPYATRSDSRQLSCHGTVDTQAFLPLP